MYINNIFKAINWGKVTCSSDDIISCTTIAAITQPRKVAVFQETFEDYTKLQNFFHYSIFRNKFWNKVFNKERL